MAVLAFAESGVEYAVLETGLGARLDATKRRGISGGISDHFDRF